MNIKSVIKFVESKGFKEYTPSSFEQYDRAWQKIIKSDDSQISVNLNFWEHSKRGVLAEDTFEFVIYTDSETNAVQIHLYAWLDIDKNVPEVYQIVEKFIEFLKTK